jgi:hypothetical protein
MKIFNWIKIALSEDNDRASSKRLLSFLAVIILIQITQVWLFTQKAFDTTQLIFLTGFWIFVAGFAQYLTVFKKIYKENNQDRDGLDKNT